MPETTSTTPQSLAVATQTIVKNVVPKPTKAQLLRATARAVSLERQAQVDKIQKEMDTVRSRIKTLAAQIASQVVKESDVSLQDWSNNHVGVNINLFTKDHPKLAPLLAKNGDLYNQKRSILINEDEIIKQIRLRADGDPDAIVDGLLKDDSVRKKLAQVGNKLLNSVTEMEKAATIPA